MRHYAHDFVEIANFVKLEYYGMEARYGDSTPHE